MSTIPSDWTFNEVATFAMLYAASVDSDTDPDVLREELGLIEKRLHPDQYKKVKSTFDKSSDAECISLIRAYHDTYFNTDKGRKKLFTCIQEVFLMDDRYSAIEKEMMSIFERLF